MVRTTARWPGRKSPDTFYRMITRTAPTRYPAGSFKKIWSISKACHQVARAMPAAVTGSKNLRDTNLRLSPQPRRKVVKRLKVYRLDHSYACQPLAVKNAGSKIDREKFGSNLHQTHHLFCDHSGREAGFVNFGVSTRSLFDFPLSWHQEADAFLQLWISLMFLIGMFLIIGRGAQKLALL